MSGNILGLNELWVVTTKSEEGQSTGYLDSTKIRFFANGNGKFWQFACSDDLFVDVETIALWVNADFLSVESKIKDLIRKDKCQFMTISDGESKPTHIVSMDNATEIVALSAWEGSVAAMNKLKEFLDSNPIAKHFNPISVARAFVTEASDDKGLDTKKSGYVYLVGCLKTGFVKIGFSLEPSRRVLSVQTGCPFPIKVLAFIPGTIQDEKLLQQRFSEFRSSGEWFSIDSLNKQLFVDAFGDGIQVGIDFSEETA